MAIELVIFDSDGVLVDSEAITQRILWEMLTEHGIEFHDYSGHGSQSLSERFAGMPLPRCLELVQEEFKISLPGDFIIQYEARMYPILQQTIQPIPGVTQVLSLLKYKTCVASSGPMAKLQITLSGSGLLPFFDGRIFCGDDVARGKPYPDIFLFAAEKMGVDCAKCVVIEDSVNGVRAGLAAGMKVFAYDPHGTLSFHAGEVKTFRDMAELPTLLLMALI